jgi:hypothetical protein
MQIFPKWLFDTTNLVYLILDRIIGKWVVNETHGVIIPYECLMNYVASKLSRPKFPCEFMKDTTRKKSLDAWKFQELGMLILSLSTTNSFTNDMFHHCYVLSPRYCHNIIFYKEWHPCRFHHTFGPLNNTHTIQEDLKLLLQFTIIINKRRKVVEPLILLP